jgi:hypothetical protein
LLFRQGKRKFGDSAIEKWMSLLYSDQRCGAVPAFVKVGAETSVEI